VRNLGTSTRAIAILGGAAVAAFAASAAAVSSATTHVPIPAVTVSHPFTAFSFTGGVSTGNPTKPAAFSLTFQTSFMLAADSPGIVNPTTGTLDNVTFIERVSYPVPSSKASPRFVGPAALPFVSDKLTLTVGIKGSCFVPSPAGGSYVFKGTLRCATSTLKLGGKTYNVSALLRSINGSFTQVPGAVLMWTGELTATFASPGYAFPVATLGSGGNTELVIGSNGATVGTRSVDFAGAK